VAQGAPAAFFSYCRDDSHFALRLAGDLKAAGAKIWLDQLDIEPGMPWDRAVESAVTNCPRMLVILSPTSVNSDNVRDEPSFALSKQKRVIPVLYQDCDIPYRLARLQYIDSRLDYARGLQALLRTLGVEQQAVAAGGPERGSPPNHDVPRLSPSPKKPRDTVFIGYSHEDQKWFDELVTILYPIRHKLKLWHDQMIKPGDEWRQEIEKALAPAKAAILLVSPNFLSSDFIENHELPPLLEAAVANGCKILWIKLKECLMDGSPIEKYQALYNEPVISSLTKLSTTKPFTRSLRKFRHY